MRRIVGLVYMDINFLQFFSSGPVLKIEDVFVTLFSISALKPGELGRSGYSLSEGSKDA